MFWSSQIFKLPSLNDWTFRLNQTIYNYEDM